MRGWEHCIGCFRVWIGLINAVFLVLMVVMVLL